VAEASGGRAPGDGGQGDGGQGDGGQGDGGPGPRRAAADVNAAPPGPYAAPSMECHATRLMTATKQGDARAFDQLVEQLRSRAFQVATSMVGSRDDALELSQETFLKIYRARQTYRDGEPFLPWFHSILRNTCFSFLRRAQRLERTTLDTDDEEGESGGWIIVDPAPAPGAAVERDEVAQAFAAALSELGPRDREILSLRHHQDLSYREIAEGLGIPEGTVMSRLYHARRRLRDRLGHLLADVEAERISDRERERLDKAKRPRGNK
jgi:RNA polymerase sigma-70 factor (ECF subfamily)